MRAIVQDRYASPETLRVAEVATPVAGAGEVLVRVRAASVHPDVWHVVTGRPYLLRLMGAGKLTPVVGRTYPLSEVPQALRCPQEGQAQGRIVLTV